MRKMLVRIFNVIFLGCAVFAAISLGLFPLMKVDLNLNFSEGNLYQMLVDNGIPTNRTKEEKAIYRLTEDEEIDILNKLSAERIVYGTDTTPGVGAVKNQKFTIELEVGSCFHPRNEAVFKEFVDKNIDNISYTLAQVVTPRLKVVIKAVAMEVAAEVITDQMQNQIHNYFDSSSGQEEPIADADTVNQIVQNAYDLFDSQETTSVAELSKVLAGTSDYVVADPQPTDAVHASHSYFVKNGEEYVKFTGNSFDPGTTYYEVKYGAGVFGVLQDMQEKEVPGFETIDYEDVDTTDIENKMVQALQTMPGLTDYRVAEPQPTGLINEATQNFYVKVGNEYQKVVGAEGQSFDPNTEYYEIIILNIDAALIGLMDYYFKTPVTKSIKRDEVVDRETSAAEESKLILTVQEKIKGLLPMGTINRITQKSVRKVTPLIFTAYFALLAFPWVLFGLITFIRLFKKEKCWTKLWVVYVFAFIELLLGVVLTVAFSKMMPKLVDTVAGRLSSKYQTYANVIKDSTVTVKTNCFVASYVYLEMIVLGIIYAIIAHRLKVNNKMVKRIEKHDKKAARMYQTQTQIIYNSPSYIAYPPYTPYLEDENEPSDEEYPGVRNK